MRSQCSRSPEQCKKEKKEEKVLGKIPGIETYRDLNKIRAMAQSKYQSCINSIINAGFWAVWAAGPVHKKKSWGWIMSNF